MELGVLVRAVDCACAGDVSGQVTGFAIDHRKVAPGNVFGAFRGARFNAEEVIPEAIAAGAVAVVARPDARVAGALHIASEEPRRTFAMLAARFFAPIPSHIVAVTGTNGKTSSVEMTRQIWRMCGERAASIGTLGVTTPDESVSTGLTTPDIVTFLSNMSGLAREGVTHVAYEASSHGLSQFRNEGVPLKAAAFTNFSRDHLDYHTDMDVYFLAKMRLFDEVMDTGGTAIIWTDEFESEWTRRAIEHAKKRTKRVLTVGARGDFIRLAAHTPTPLGQTIQIAYEGSIHTITLPLIGAYQAANALIAAALVLDSGCASAQVLDALSRLQPVRGRLERAVITPWGAPVYVDYAHTADALEAAIMALKPHVDARAGGALTVVFGAGGDRDAGKREAMGRVAARHCERVIVTDDNPRGEDPASIRAAILKGAEGAKDVGDRREAIGMAVRHAGAKDMILIAGKGHETGQIIGSGDTMQILPFDDVRVARECAALAEKVQ